MTAYKVDERVPFKPHVWKNKGMWHWMRDRDVNRHIVASSVRDLQRCLCLAHEVTIE